MQGARQVCFDLCRLAARLGAKAECSPGFGSLAVVLSPLLVTSYSCFGLLRWSGCSSDTVIIY